MTIAGVILAEHHEPILGAGVLTWLQPDIAPRSERASWPERFRALLRVAHLRGSEARSVPDALEALLDKKCRYAL